MKQQKVKTETNCNFTIGLLETKIEIHRLDDSGRLNVAKSMVIDSIIDFIGEENTNGKLLCELSPNSIYGPILIQQNSVVQQLDPDPVTKQLWAQSLDLPFHGQHATFHGRFLNNDDILDEVQETDCWLQIYSGEFGSTLHHSHCKPYALIYGKKKSNVIRAVEAVKRAMRSHQRKCECTPRW